MTDTQTELLLAVARWIAVNGGPPIRYVGWPEWYSVREALAKANHEQDHPPEAR